MSSRPKLSEEQMLRIAQQHLSPQDFQIYEMHYWEHGDGLTQWSTAKRLGISVPTVTRAVVRIKELIASHQQRYQFAVMPTTTATPRYLIREKFPCVVERNHAGKAVCDNVVRLAIGAEFRRIERRIRQRMEQRILESEEEAA